MLRSRVITSVILAAFVVGALLLLSTNWLSGALALMFLVAGGWENARLAGVEHVVGQALWVIALCLAGAALIWISHNEAAVPAIFGGASLGWLVLALWLRFPAFGKCPDGRFQPSKLVIVGLILLAAFIAIAWMHFHSPWQVIFLILIVAAADIGAYFTGHRFGGPKLAPVISPGKTWSGVAGGLVAAMATAAVASQLLPDIPLGLVAAAFAALPLVLFSVLGDLLVSLFKRHRGLKDTSALLPGHGGMLDRIDGLSAAAPLIALIFWWAAAGA